MDCFYIGNFEQPYKSENYIAYALEQNGVCVTRWQQDQPADLCRLAEHIHSQHPDFVLFTKNRVPGDGAAFIRDLQHRGIKTVCWLFDLYFDLPWDAAFGGSPDESQFLCDHVFTTDGGHQRRWAERGVCHDVLRQGIHAPEAMLGNSHATDVEVAFVGTPYYGERIRLIEFLRKTYGGRFEHYGLGGIEPEVRGLALNDLLASVKVVVGDSMPSPYYWSNRVYEVIGRGGFLLHPRVEGLDQEVREGEHIMTFEYGNLGQVRELVDHYLDDETARERIRLAGFRHVRENHTYTHRCRELLQRIRAGQDALPRCQAAGT